MESDGDRIEGAGIPERAGQLAVPNWKRSIAHDSRAYEFARCCIVNLMGIFTMEKRAGRATEEQCADLHRLAGELVNLNPADGEAVDRICEVYGQRVAAHIAHKAGRPV